MAEFDGRWKRLAAAARRAEVPERALGEVELARLARTADAARPALAPARALGDVELARLARTADAAQPAVAPVHALERPALRACSSHVDSELHAKPRGALRTVAFVASLAAAVAALLIGLHCAWPDRASFDAFTSRSLDELAALSRSVPRAPRFVPGNQALEALPDVGGALRSFVTAVESSP